MLSGDGNENVGLIITKTALHVQHTFFAHFIAVVLHNYNVKLPETSELHVLRRTDVVCVPANSIFLLPLIFTLVTASISHFLTAAIKFSRFSSNEIGLFLSRSSSFAVIQVNVDIKILKFSRKKGSGLLLLYFFSLKSGWPRDLQSKRASTQNVKFHPSLHEGVVVRTNGRLTKISRMQ